MPQSSLMRLNVGLSMFASGYFNGDLIADRVLPIIEMEKRKGTYFTRSRKDATTILDDEVGDTTVANEADYELSSASVTVKGRALTGYVSNVQVAEADKPNQPFQDKVDNLMLRLMLGREYRVATLVQTAGSYAATAAAIGLWSNHAASKPIRDLTLAVSRVAPDASGKTKIVAAMSEETFFELAQHPDVLGLRPGGGSSGGMAGDAEIAQMLKVCRISELLVSNAERNSANRGQAGTFARIWDKTKVAVLRVPINPKSGYTGCFGGTFRWKRPESGTQVYVQDWEEPRRGESGSTGVKCAYAEDIAVVQNDAGTLITSVLS